MKWFDRWFAKKCKEAWENENVPREEILPSPIRAGHPRKMRDDVGNSLNSNCVNFSLYTANGGSVVELREYDHTMDRHKNILYVIPSDKDLGEQLGHIVTMEALKR